MHIPDGFLDTKTAVASAALATGGLALALRQVRRDLPPRKVPLLGLTAAFVFAAQMVNFPVAGGTSGHLVGGVLTTVLLGPAAAVVVMTAVLVVQCFLFADGGVTALGANVFNMAVLAPTVGYLVYRGTRRLLPGLAGRIGAAAFAGWCSTVAAAIACAGQLALAGMARWELAISAMTGVHMLIGIGEGLITALVLTALARTRPELLDEPAALSTPPAAWAMGLVVTLGLAVFVAPFACSWPDGLEKVAEALGFSGRAAELVIAAPFADYLVPHIQAAGLATAWAGLIGTVMAFLGSIWLGKALVAKNPDGPHR